MLFSLIQHIAANVLAKGSEALSYNLADAFASVYYDHSPPTVVLVSLILPCFHSATIAAMFSGLLVLFIAR